MMNEYPNYPYLIFIIGCGDDYKVVERVIKDKADEEEFNQFLTDSDPLPMWFNEETFNLIKAYNPIKYECGGCGLEIKHSDEDCLLFVLSLIKMMKGYQY